MHLRVSLTVGAIALVLALSMCSAPATTATPEPTSTPTAALPPTATPIPGEKQEALVLRISDGDTIYVELDGKHYSVRYIGIDTPETHHPTDGADYWGFEATEANKAMVKVGATVLLQRDISETDIYGRLLRYVFVGDTLVNAELVRMGLARVLFYEPDVLYRSEVKAAEAEAQQAKRGLYGPLPTPPAEKPVLYKGKAWTTAPSGETVSLRYDPARGDPIMSFPVGAQVRLADAFWVPETEQWWYWIGIQEFNGWVTGEYVTTKAPATAASGPSASFVAYDDLVISKQADVYALPEQGSEVVLELPPGARVQVRRLSWEQATGTWWYFFESTRGEGWVALEYLDD